MNQRACLPTSVRAGRRSAKVNVAKILRYCLNMTKVGLMSLDRLSVAPGRAVQI